MAETISAFGKEGAGKTTIAISLAECLNNLGHRTLLISAETRFGVIQRRLNTEIEKKKSMYFGFLGEFKDKSFYKRVRENLYIASLADEDDITSYNELEDKIVKDSIKEMNKDFDFIVVDCTSRATDSLSFHFLNNSNHIINVVESSVDGMLFQNAHKKLLSSSIFENKKINVLNKHNENLINLRTVEEITETEYQAIYKFSTEVIEDAINFEQNKMIQKISNNLLFYEIKKEKIKEEKGLRKVIGKIVGL